MGDGEHGIVWKDVRLPGVDGTRLEDLDEQVIDQVLRVNLRGPLLLSQAAAVSMERRGGGSQVHVGSVAATRAQVGGGVYGASKAGLARVVGQLAVELGRRGIRVNLVSPGQTPTVLVSYRTAPGAPPARPGQGRPQRRGRADPAAPPRAARRRGRRGRVPAVRSLGLRDRRGPAGRRRCPVVAGHRPAAVAAGGRHHGVSGKAQLP